MKSFPLLLLAALLVPPASQALDFENSPASLQQRTLNTAASIGLGDQPLGALPEGLAAPETGLALIADYAHAAPGGIPVFLVNRTGKVISLGTQDRDVYLKLEFQAADGTWQRAQPHQMSRCGNSYGFRAPVRNDHFIALTGYQPGAGEKVKIRFRLYRQGFEAASNTGEGLISRAEAEAAQHDQFSFFGASFEVLAALAQGHPAPPDRIPRDSTRQLAIHELGTRGFDRVKTEEVLTAIVTDGDEAMAKAVRQALSALKRYSP